MCQSRGAFYHTQICRATPIRQNLAGEALVHGTVLATVSDPPLLL